MSCLVAPAAIAKADRIFGRPGRENSDRYPSEPSEKAAQWFGQFHVWDFITADATEGKPDWFTVKNYPLNYATLYGRWRNPGEFIGVRFSTKHSSNGGVTQYLLLDVDIDSQYHPYNDSEQFQRLLTVLQTIGLHRVIRIRSSSSEGLHLYHPLPKPLPCRNLAIALHNCLSKAGFVIGNGQLELFPNVRSGKRVLFTAHRLPLQNGSFVLDEELQPIHNSLDLLIDEWNEVATQQDFDLLEKIVEDSKFLKYRNSGAETEWCKRLETELAKGFTDYGQTNHLLKECCIYARVFQGLEWDDVEQWVLGKVVQLPRYRKYCRHQHEIHRRVQDWVTCNRKNNRYYPYGSRAKKPKVLKAPPNEIRSQEALQRIRNAIAAILMRDSALPRTVKERQNLICKEAQCSASTLRKHMELWHPEHLEQVDATVDHVDNPAVAEVESESVTHEVETISASWPPSNDAGSQKRNGHSGSLSESGYPDRKVVALRNYSAAGFATDDSQNCDRKFEYTDLPEANSS